MKTQYECPYCKREYSDYDSAYDCSVDCSNVDPVIANYICDYCKKTSSKGNEINECERKHENDQDELFHTIKFNEASSHPSQSKLEF